MWFHELGFLSTTCTISHSFICLMLFFLCYILSLKLYLYKYHQPVVKLSCVSIISIIITSFRIRISHSFIHSCIHLSIHIYSFMIPQRSSFTSNTFWNTEYNITTNVASPVLTRCRSRRRLYVYGFVNDSMRYRAKNTFCT